MTPETPAVVSGNDRSANGDILSLVAQATALRTAGRDTEALACIELAIRQEPEAVSLLLGWGIGLLDAEQPAAAAALFQSGLALLPKHSGLHLQLGNAWRQQGEGDKAIACYRRAIWHDGMNVPALYILVVALVDKGRNTEAVAIAKLLYWAGPHHPMALHGVAIAMFACGRFQDASDYLEHATTMAPTATPAWALWGSALQFQSKFVEAEAAFRRALALDPHRRDCLTSLAEVRAYMGFPTEAKALYQQAYDLQSSAGLLYRQAGCIGTFGASDEAVATERATILKRIKQLASQGLRISDPLTEASCVIANLSYQGLNDRPIMEAAGSFLRGACPSLQWTAPHCGRDRIRPTGGRIRIGFASRYLYDHEIGRLVLPWILGLDRRRFHVSIWHWGPEDDVVRSFADRVDHVSRLSGSLSDMQKELAAAELDMLVYPEIGLDVTGYCLAFARLAPVQLAAWGHPVTSGLTTIDYFVSERDMEPADAALHYTEKLILLAGMPAYQVSPDRVQAPTAGHRSDRAAFGFDPDWHLYGCLQSIANYQPGFDLLIAQILRRDPQGRMVIRAQYPSWGQLWTARFGSAYPDVAKRVILLPELSQERYLTLLHTLDVALDPPTYAHGHNTYDALLAGTPVVTLPGPCMRSRRTLAYLRKIGMLDTVAKNGEAYVALATRMATDSVWRQGLRTRLIEALPLLTDPGPISRSFQDMLLQLADTHLG